MRRVHLLCALGTVGALVEAFVPCSPRAHFRPALLGSRRATGERAPLRFRPRPVLRMGETSVAKAQRLNKVRWDERLESLEKQAIADFQTALREFPEGPPVLTTALIAGDQVILHILKKAGLLRDVKVLFIDTFHLFDETYDFLRQVEQHYGFKASGTSPARKIAFGRSQCYLCGPRPQEI